MQRFVILLTFQLFIFWIPVQAQILLPIKLADRTNLNALQITAIGNFGRVRKARLTVPGHLHTGIDIKRPGANYTDEPIYPITKGLVVSKRTDGPYAQLIIEHFGGDPKIWSVYEHVAGICVNAGDFVTPYTPIARFMNEKELNTYGWQFNHFHLEILKEEPKKWNPSAEYPERFFRSYGLVCYDEATLLRYYYSPLEFFSQFLVQ